MAEEVLNNSLRCLGEFVRNTASATHTLFCGVLERDSNETKYLKEALEMIHGWQARCSRRSSGSHDGGPRGETAVVYCGRVPYYLREKYTNLCGIGMRNTVERRAVNGRFFFLLCVVHWLSGWGLFDVS